MKTTPMTLPVSQRGAALAVGLVFLLVLTIIGVSALSTTSLEERMAGNLQEQTKAFQTAEAAVVRTLNVSGLNTADVCNTTEQTFTDIDTANQTTAITCRDFLGTTAPGRTTDTAYGGETSFVHFGINSRGETPTKARVFVNQGVYQLGPEAPGLLIE
jgi:Tfp pilus assembly protein PilX